MRKKLLRLHKTYSLAQRRHVRSLHRTARKPFFAIPVLTFLSLLVVVVAFALVSSGGKPQLQPSGNTNIVIVTHDKQQRTIPTSAKNVGQLLTRLHIPLREGDVVEPSKDTPIIGNNFRINVYRAVPVTIVDGVTKKFVYSAAVTPRSIAKQVGLTVYPEDRLELLPTENFLTESSIGGRVVIDRATPINMNIYGTPVALRTHADTVGQLLKERNITLGKDDEVVPVQKTKLTSATQVFLIRKGAQISTVEEAVGMPTETVGDESLSYGAVVVRQQGAPGKKLVTYQIDLQNGQEVGRKIIQEVVVQEPVKQVIAKGTRQLSMSLQTWLYKLRMCESGGNYQTNTGNGYYGAYQFSQATWNRIARQRMGIPYERADLAPPEVQDQAIITNTNLSKGGLTTQNPGCYKKEGLSAFPPGS